MDAVDFEVPSRLKGGAAFLGFASIRLICGQKNFGQVLGNEDTETSTFATANPSCGGRDAHSTSLRAGSAVPYGEGEASSSSDMGITPGIMPGEASNIPVLLSGCIAARTWKVRFSSPRITVTGTTSPAVT